MTNVSRMTPDWPGGAKTAPGESRKPGARRRAPANRKNIYLEEAHRARFGVPFHHKNPIPNQLAPGA